MVEDKKNGEQERGFVVKDKRFSAQKEEEAPGFREEEKKREEPPEGETAQQEVPLPEINFMSFLFSLSTSALIQLGVIEDPISQQMAKDFPLAKQTIDLIGMLKEKTKGNLSPDEDKMMENILYDLRMRYLKAAG